MKKVYLNIQTLDKNNNFIKRCFVNDSIEPHNASSFSVNIISYLDDTMVRHKHSSTNKMLKKDIPYIRKKLVQDYDKIIGCGTKCVGWKCDRLQNTSSIQDNHYNNRIHIKKNLHKIRHFYNKWKTYNSENPLFVKPTITNGYIFNNVTPKTFPNESVKTMHVTKFPKKKVDIDESLDSLEDLILLSKKYPLDVNIEYNININAIHNIVDSLVHLNNMIGINGVKNSIFDQILYYIQDFHNLPGNDNDFMHTVISGPPGTGKTEIAKCIGNIFSKLGILKNGTFKKVTRSDLIAGYLGQTAAKTRTVIESSLGGVLFIDEAYSLGNNERGDSYSKECIDTLCEALSDHKQNLMVIIAGYEKELKSCFFDYNKGLESRFTWRFKTTDYDSDELYDIFVKKVTDSGWSISKTNYITKCWFKKNHSYFRSFGRNIETLFSKTKIAHSKRVFCKPKHEKTVLTKEDVIKGFELYKINECDSEDEKLTSAEHMYV